MASMAEEGDPFSTFLEIADNIDTNECKRGRRAVCDSCRFVNCTELQMYLKKKEKRYVAEEKGE